MDLLSRLRPVTFDWKNSGQEDLGLIAEEVAELEPLLITTNEQGQVEGVKYDRINMVLINAVKEQQQSIQDLKKHNDQLRGTIEDLIERIEKLEIYNKKQ